MLVHRAVGFIVFVEHAPAAEIFDKQVNLTGELESSLSIGLT
ncbi:MAG TPA: hypothetical protein VHY08_02855 [Bacillota bacterium]|nr:hypothetical protein [Bacillota bacterium]